MEPSNVAENIFLKNSVIDQGEEFSVIDLLAKVEEIRDFCTEFKKNEKDIDINVLKDIIEFIEINVIILKYFDDALIECFINDFFPRYSFIVYRFVIILLSQLDSSYDYMLNAIDCLLRINIDRVIFCLLMNTTDIDEIKIILYGVHLICSSINIELRMFIVSNRELMSFILNFHPDDFDFIRFKYRVIHSILLNDYDVYNKEDDTCDTSTTIEIVDFFLPVLLEGLFANEADICAISFSMLKNISYFSEDQFFDILGRNDNSLVNRAVYLLSSPSIALQTSIFDFFTLLISMYPERIYVQLVESGFFNGLLHALNERIENLESAKDVIKSIFRVKDVKIAKTFFNELIVLIKDYILDMNIDLKIFILDVFLHVIETNKISDSFITSVLYSNILPFLESMALMSNQEIDEKIVKILNIIKDFVNNKDEFVRYTRNILTSNDHFVLFDESSLFSLVC